MPITPDTDRLDAAVKASRDPRSLVGSFFHGNGPDWRGHQGCVVGEPAPGIYLVEVFEWLTGSSSCQTLVKIDTMIGWEFYDSPEWMDSAYTNRVRHKWDREYDRSTEEIPA